LPTTNARRPIKRSKDVDFCVVHSAKECSGTFDSLHVQTEK